MTLNEEGFSKFGFLFLKISEYVDIYNSLIFIFDYSIVSSLISFAYLDV